MRTQVRRDSGFVVEDCLRILRWQGYLRSSKVLLINILCSPSGVSQRSERIQGYERNWTTIGSSGYIWEVARFLRICWICNVDDEFRYQNSQGGGRLISRARAQFSCRSQTQSHQKYLSRVHIRKQGRMIESHLVVATGRGYGENDILSRANKWALFATPYSHLGVSDQLTSEEMFSEHAKPDNKSWRHLHIRSSRCHETGVVPHPALIVLYWSLTRSQIDKLHHNLSSRATSQQFIVVFLRQNFILK